MQTAQTLFFTNPKQVEVREIPLPIFKGDEVLLETV